MLQSVSASITCKPRDTLHQWLRLLLPALLLMLLPFSHARAQDLMTPAQVQQRQLYQEALAALAHADLAQFKTLRAQLSGYALLPYLDHAELSSRLDSLPQAEVHDFLQAHAGSVLALQLQRQWQQVLAANARWSQLIADYNPRNASTELRCQVLQARLTAGDTSALDEVTQLWNVASSQPNLCDPVFDAWREAGRLTPELAWQRFNKAIDAGHLGFARYLSTLLAPREQQLATLWLDTANQPTLLRNLDAYSGEAPELTPLLLDNLRRLAQRDASLAWELSETYAGRRGFAADAYLALQRYITLRLLSQDQVARAESLLRANPALPSDTLVEWLLRDALKQQDWQRLDQWLPLLSPEAQASERWRYWQARSLAQQGTSQAASAAQTLLSQVAGTRSFYGFLAADLLRTDYALVDRPVAISDSELQALLTRPALLRAVELYLVDDESNALREWQQALATMAEPEVLAAAKLAERIGWYRNGIQALIQVSYWDDLTLRFPLAYRDMVGQQTARHQGLDSSFIYAIARQESAFVSNASSSAGALGLMQLMPGTARDAARETGFSLSSNLDLFKPEINLALGSYYLDRMLRDFEGNRILAAAAYNAGPARVRRWRDAGKDSPLPADIWIETIPFGETRGYVQNVLAYSVIYGYRMGQPVSMLTPAEAAALL